MSRPASAASRAGCWRSVVLCVPHVNNNPVNYTDPSGHAAQPALIGGYVQTSGPDANLLQVAESLMPGIGSRITNVGYYDGFFATVAGVLWEPADWAIALSDGFQWYDGLGMLPIVPAAFGDNIGRAAAKFIPAGLSDNTGRALGHWVDLPASTAATDWARYQAYVTGVDGMDFMFNGVKFDGAVGQLNDTGSLILLDAKQWSSSGFVKHLNQSWAQTNVLEEARRQLRAIAGTDIGIQWHFYDKQAADTVKQFFQDQGIYGIDVQYTPWQ